MHPYSGGHVSESGLPEARLSRSMRRGGQLTFPGLTNLHVTRTCWRVKWNQCSGNLFSLNSATILDYLHAGLIYRLPDFSNLLSICLAQAPPRRPQLKAKLTGCSTAPAGIMMRRPDPLQCHQIPLRAQLLHKLFLVVPAAFHGAAARVDHEGDEEVSADRRRICVNWNMGREGGKS